MEYETIKCQICGNLAVVAQKVPVTDPFAIQQPYPDQTVANGWTNYVINCTQCGPMFQLEPPKPGEQH